MKRLNSNKQRGAALITALIFIIVISTLGISIAKQVINQRNVSSSHYDQIITFSNAESGIQEAEAIIEQNSASIALILGLPGVTSTALATNWWKTDANWTSAATATDGGGNALQGNPEYIIEDMGSENGRHFYRVTTRATGPSGATSFLQTTYAILEP